MLSRLLSTGRRAVVCSFSTWSWMYVRFSSFWSWWQGAYWTLIEWMLGQVYLWDFLSFFLKLHVVIKNLWCGLIRKVHIKLCEWACVTAVWLAGWLALASSFMVAHFLTPPSAFPHILLLFVWCTLGSGRGTDPLKKQLLFPGYFLGGSIPSSSLPLSDTLSLAAAVECVGVEAISTE